jgi:hypothetical protein
VVAALAISQYIGLTSNSQIKGSPAGPVVSGADSSSSPTQPPVPVPQAVPAPASMRPIPTGPGPAFSGPSSSSNMGVSQANIDQIMDIVPDFTREQVVNALRVTDDNIEQAVDLLFSVRALF